MAPKVKINTLTMALVEPEVDMKRTMMDNYGTVNLHVIKARGEKQEEADAIGPYVFEKDRQKGTYTNEHDYQTKVLAYCKERLEPVEVTNKRFKGKQKLTPLQLSMKPEAYKLGGRGLTAAPLNANIEPRRRATMTPDGPAHARIAERAKAAKKAKKKADKDKARAEEMFMDSPATNPYDDKEQKPENDDDSRDDDNSSKGSSRGEDNDTLGSPSLNDGKSKPYNPYANAHDEDTPKYRNTMKPAIADSLKFARTDGEPIPFPCEDRLLLKVNGPATKRKRQIVKLHAFHRENGMGKARISLIDVNSGQAEIERVRAEKMYGMDRGSMLDKFHRKQHRARIRSLRNLVHEAREEDMAAGKIDVKWEKKKKKLKAKGKMGSSKVAPEEGGAGGEGAEGKAVKKKRKKEMTEEEQLAIAVAKEKAAHKKRKDMREAREEAARVPKEPFMNKVFKFGKKVFRIVCPCLKDKSEHAGWDVTNEVNRARWKPHIPSLDSMDPRKMTVSDLQKLGGKVGRKANPAYVLGTAQHSFKLARTKFKTFMDGHDGLKSLDEFICAAGEGDLKTVCNMLDRQVALRLAGPAAPNMPHVKTGETALYRCVVRVMNLEVDEEREETSKGAEKARKMLEGRGVGNFDLTIDRLLDDESIGMDINHRPNGPEKGGLTDGWGILHHAIHLRNEHRVDWLLEREDVDLNLPALNTGITPLMIASKEGQLDLVLKLIEAGADTKIKDVNKWTCLHFAGAYGGTRIAKFLLMAGADKYAMSTSYKSAADVALDAGKERVHAFISKYLEKPDPHKECLDTLEEYYVMKDAVKKEIEKEEEEAKQAEEAKKRKGAIRPTLSSGLFSSSGMKKKLPGLVEAGR